MNSQLPYLFVSAVVLASAVIMNNPVQIFFSGIVIAIASYRAGEMRSNYPYTESHKEESK